jgi:hypothetical protein
VSGEQRENLEAVLRQSAYLMSPYADLPPASAEHVTA